MRIVILLCLMLIGVGCLKNDSLNLPFDSIQPIVIGDGLQISYPSNENMDSIGLSKIYESIHGDENLWSIRSLLVFRNNRLVSEVYFKDNDDITTRHLIWSCTKQVMGILSGIAIDKGVISTINDPISKYLTPEIQDHADKTNITIRDLLTMQSGIDYHNEGKAGQTDKLLSQVPENMIDFILSRPTYIEPGVDFYYKDSDPQILSAIIQKTTGKPTDVWADEVFFSKIGVKNYNWVRYKDGITFGGFGLETTPRELGKIALCVANDGKWNNQQVVPSEWIPNMTRPQVDAKGTYQFGYFWWIDPQRGIYFMWGQGGQFAFVVPAKNLVVVITSIPNTTGKYEIQADEALPLVQEIMDLSY